MKDTLIIKIKNNRIYYTHEYYVPLHASCFPEGMEFLFDIEIYWKIQLINYDGVIHHLDAEILNYTLDDITTFDKQKTKGSLKGINFYKISWNSIKPLLQSYDGNSIRKILFYLDEESKLSLKEYRSPIPYVENIPSVRINKPSTNIVDKQDDLVDDYEILYSEKIKEDTEFVVERDYTCYFKNAEFKLGYVLVNKTFDFLNEKIQLKIHNSDILPEYDYIKTFFPKALNTSKQFNVKAKVTVKSGDIISIDARSKEIDQINEQIIDSVKQLRTIGITKVVLEPEIDKSLFTADEIFSYLTDNDLDGNVFKQNEEDIINMLLDLKNIRNRKQLEFLAGSKHSPSEKIRFTLKPNFGFIFYIEGEKMNHYCWELLDTHATYLWSIEKYDVPGVQLKRIEETINLIREMGRNPYKSAYRKNSIDSDILFNVITHKNSGSDFIDHFVTWKHSLKELLI